MNREIKFRAWNGKEMLPYLTILNGGQVLLTPSSCEVEIMQYTGLKDSKGTEIYEGDLVYMNDSWKNAEVVITELGTYGTADELGCCTEWNIKEWNECEVIGNIYESELLTK